MATRNQTLKKKSVGIYELLGIAVGCIGMSYGDFCACTFGEFEAICSAWQGMAEGRSHDAWERMRTLAAISIQPHVRKRITPRGLLPLPWDSAKSASSRRDTPHLTSEEKRDRFGKLVGRLGG